MREQFKSMVVSTVAAPDSTLDQLRTREYGAVEIIVREGSSELEVIVYPKIQEARAAVSGCLNDKPKQKS